VPVPPSTTLHPSAHRFYRHAMLTRFAAGELDAALHVAEAAITLDPADAVALAIAAECRVVLASARDPEVEVLGEEELVLGEEAGTFEDDEPPTVAPETTPSVEDGLRRMYHHFVDGDLETAMAEAAVVLAQGSCDMAYVVLSECERELGKRASSSPTFVAAQPGVPLALGAPAKALRSLVDGRS